MSTKSFPAQMLMYTYLMEYTEDWSVPKTYFNPKFIQTLLLNAA